MLGKHWRIGPGFGLAISIATFLAALCAARGLAETARLVADIHRGPLGLSSDGPELRQLTSVGNRVVFVAYEPSSGTELWVSDGTMLGTRLLRELEPGTTSADNLRLLGSDGEIAFFYFGSEGAADSGVWRTDGTAGGTFPLGFSSARDDFLHESPAAVMRGSDLFVTICPDGGACELWRSDGTVGGSLRLNGGGQVPESFAGLTVVGGSVYFTGRADGTSSLWKSDGTPAGTAKVRPDGSFQPSETLLAAAGTRLVFVAHGADGQELWASNGTTAGTVPLTAFAAPLPFDRTSFLKTLGNVVYFLADDVIGGTDLWRSDGTASGTYRVTDFGYASPFAFHFQPQSLAQLGNRLFFAATDGLSQGLRLWTSRGTPATTAEMTGCPGGCPLLGSDAEFVSLGSRLVFTGYEPVASTPGLWSTDGTPGGTTRLPVELCRGCNSAAGLVVVGGRVYFLGNNPGVLGAAAAWVSDGTPAGTRLLAPVGDAYFSLERFEAAGVPGGVLFEAPDERRVKQLWATDGTAAGTAPISVLHASGGSSSPLSITPLADRGVVFMAVDGSSRSIWKSDGTAGGTAALTATQAPQWSTWYLRPFTAHGGLVYFTLGDQNGNHPQLWRTDGTDAGTRQLTSFATASVGELVVFDGKLVLTVVEQQPAHVSLWTTDGTLEGTRLLLDLPIEVSAMRDLTALGHELYFVGDDYYNGTALAWRSDGTPAGTRTLTPAHRDTFSEGPARFTRLGSSVYFRAVASNFFGAARLWRTDGTAAGTATVFPEQPAPGTFGIDELSAAAGSLLYFAPAEVGSSNPTPALYRSDGTAAGTVELARFATQRGLNDVPGPMGFTVLGGNTFFVADDDVHGEELWVTDGTAAGTHVVRDLAPGPSPSRPRQLTVVGGRLFFAATDSEHGVELWSSDGSAAGTRMVQDLAPGGLSSNPHELTASAGQLFFAADDGVWGTELWSLPLAGGGCQPTAERLCLGGGRYAVDAQWRDFSGNSGPGHPVALTADTGYFWFFGAGNVEVILKVLDGRGVNGHTWVFYGALSSVGYTLTVTDTMTGAARRYVNLASRLASVADTIAFGPLGATPSSLSFGPQAAASAAAAPVAARRTTTAAPCVPAATRLCLNDGRFAVEARWNIPGGSGAGQAVPLTGDTGYLWFFDAANVELVVKVLDGRPVNGKFWLFYGALSDVGYTLTVTDTMTGAVKQYQNPRGRLASVADTAAF